MKKEKNNSRSDYYQDLFKLSDEYLRASISAFTEYNQYTRSSMTYMVTVSTLFIGLVISIFNFTNNITLFSYLLLCFSLLFGILTLLVGLALMMYNKRSYHRQTGKYANLAKKCNEFISENKTHQIFGALPDKLIPQKTRVSRKEKILNYSFFCFFFLQILITAIVVALQGYKLIV